MKVNARGMALAMSEFIYRCYGTYGTPPSGCDIDLSVVTSDPGNGIMCTTLILEANVEKSSSWRASRSDSAIARLELFSSEDGLQPVLSFIESTKINIEERTS